MITIRNIEDTVIELRRMIIKQSQLEPDNVMNALSVFGAEPSRKKSKIIESFTHEDNFIVFELFETGDNVDMTELDGSISIFATYQFRLLIYGPKSATLSQTLRGRLRTYKVLYDLNAYGIHITDIENPIPVNDFINNVLYERRDLVIYFEVKLVADQIDDHMSFTDIGTVEVHKKGDLINE